MRPDCAGARLRAPGSRIPFDRTACPCPRPIVPSASASRPARPAGCTWAAPALRTSTGSSRAVTAARSCCASRTRTPRDPPVSEARRARRPALARAAVGRRPRLRQPVRTVSPERAPRPVPRTRRPGHARARVPLCTDRSFRAAPSGVHRPPHYDELPTLNADQIRPAPPPTNPVRFGSPTRLDAERSRCAAKSRSRRAWSATS